MFNWTAMVRVFSYLGTGGDCPTNGLVHVFMFPQLITYLERCCCSVVRALTLQARDDKSRLGVPQYDPQGSSIYLVSLYDIVLYFKTN